MVIKPIKRKYFYKLNQDGRPSLTHSMCLQVKVEDHDDDGSSDARFLHANVGSSSSNPPPRPVSVKDVTISSSSLTLAICFSFPNLKKLINDISTLCLIIVIFFNSITYAAMLMSILIGGLNKPNIYMVLIFCSQPYLMYIRQRVHAGCKVRHY